mgnify:FL=1
MRRKRLGRRAYIRSVHLLPSLATLGNAVCGFGAIYVAAFAMNDAGDDPWAQTLARHSFVAASVLLLVAMVFDALDGRLARFARHTTDFGGQLDSLADAVSFGAAPAFLALQVFKSTWPGTPLPISRLVWAIGAIYFACALIRLARFNVSNQHGEQAHMSFFGLPSPGAAGAVIGLVLIQQDLRLLVAPVMTAAGTLADPAGAAILRPLYHFCTAILPIVVLASGLLMVSAIRYPHVVNKYLRGTRSIKRLVLVVVVAALLITLPRYTLGLGMIAFAAGPPIAYLLTLRNPASQPAVSVGDVTPEHE